MTNDDPSVGPVRQFVILSGVEPEDAGSLPAIGPRAEIVEKLAQVNTSPESAEAEDVLYGPGIRVELTPDQDPIRQMLVTVTEEEIGWKVLTRLINHFQWKLLDTVTGQQLGPGSPTPPADA